MGRNIDDTKIFALKYFSFLITDFGFNKPTEKWVSYNFLIKYLKDNIEIDIAVENDGSSMPWVTLVDRGEPSKEDVTLNFPKYYRIDSIEDNSKLKSIHDARNERYNPKVKKFVKEYKPDNYNETHKQLVADYDTFGQKELEMILIESAEIIKRHKEILSGDLSAFPKLRLFRAKKVKQQKLKSVSNLFKFIKGK